MVTLSTSCQEEDLSLQVVKTSILNEEARMKDKGVLSHSDANVSQHLDKGRNRQRSPPRREKSHARGKLNVIIVESLDISRRTSEEG